MNRRIPRWKVALTYLITASVAVSAYQQPVSAAPRQREAAVRGPLALAAGVSSATLLARYTVSAEDTGGTLGNSVLGGAAATLRNGPTYAHDEPWMINTARSIGLDGVDDYVDSPVAVSTADSFTVSAWVKPVRVDRAQTVISQSGTRVANFRLGVSAAGKWQLVAPRSDADTATVDTVTGPAAVALKWVHLVGVHDATAKTVRFYLNGTRIGTAAHNTPWAATNGGLQWGRALVAGEPGEYLSGTVKEMQVFQGVLNERRIADLVVSADTARKDRCEIAQYLHAGGPAVKAVAGAALAGNDYDRREAKYGNWAPIQPLETARFDDQSSYLTAWRASADRHDGWEAVIEPYEIWGPDFGTFWQAPEYGEPMFQFLMRRNDATFQNYFVRPAPPKPSPAELDKALAIAAEMRSVDPWFSPQEFEVRAWSANTVERFLRYGGYPKTAPADGSMEFRTEVESIKMNWAACETGDPDGTVSNNFLRTPGPLAAVVDTADAEWAAELASVAGPRTTIVAAETQAMLDVRAASDAMVEAQGQAWVAGQILKWQKYWLSRPKTDLGYPTAAQFAKGKTDLTAAQNRVSAELALAKAAAASAQRQSTRVSTAQIEAAAIAKSNATPMYRGLAYAQQSAQVAKASAAAAEAASKAIEATLNAVKATNADGNALESLALTQQSAMQAEFRRVAAQEAAAQAHAAALAAADLATTAAAMAATAKKDRATAEAAEQTAKTAAADAHAKLLVAEKERDNAGQAKQRADVERAKSASARAQADQEQAAAASARSRAESSADTAAGHASRAENSEYDARIARDAAVAAERNRDATAARARSLEAIAAATAGTSDATAARAAANDAKAAASAAGSAAVSARAAANSATDAAVAARTAATQADGAAQRSRAASNGAEAAAATTRSAWRTATAAAADAIQAAATAASSAKQAEVQAATAATKAIEARTNATASQEHADAATAESARTAGAAYAAGEASSAARDSALEAVTAALDAIAMGTPFEATDASAGMAVLVGQTAKTYAEQQAAAAKVKADEAARAAQAAKDAAARAQSDAKLAAEAASAAAADAAAAAQSALKARVSAAAAQADADAAKAAEQRCRQYDVQAQADALSARFAANDAETQARQANDAASEAEKDAGAARGAANEAESDAEYARGAATRADNSATNAEESAANARGYATESQAAAERAEQQERLDDLADRQTVLDRPAPNVPGLSAADEQLLLASCGQPCVDEYRQAAASANLDVLDWLKQNGGQILLDLIGYTDAKKCFTEGDVEGCLWTAVNAVSLALLVGKIPAVAACIVRVAAGIGKFFRESSLAVKTVERFKKMLQNLRRGAETPDVKLGKPAKPGDNVSFPHRRHPKLGSDGKFYVQEGDRTTKIVDPQNMGHEFTDIDLVKDGILWEEKTAVSPRLTEDLMPGWVENQVGKKLRKYLEARPYVAGYEKAPVGIMFTDESINPVLKKYVEQTFKELRAEFPGTDFRLEWPL